MPLDKFQATNRANWDDRVPIHLKAKTVYGIDGFIADPERISPTVEFDRDQLGDVTGKSLLHLQCHIGHDTLSWARLGATVTGVDFSEPAIAAARDISLRSGSPGRFVVAELYDSPAALPEQFDIVYTGVGALCWLPNIAEWANVVAKFVRPGGVFYIREAHPIAWALDFKRTDDDLVIALPYFEGEPRRYEQDVTYVEIDEKVQNEATYEWNHGLGEIITALIDAGFRIDALREYQFIEWQMTPGMVQGDDGMWRLPDGPERLPLMYSLRATRDP